MANQKSTNYETCADIIATFSILEKWGFDEMTGNLTKFCAFLDEIGFKTFNGLQITSSNLTNMFRRLSKKEKESLIEEFNSAFNYFHKIQEMTAPKIIH